MLEVIRRQLLYLVQFIEKNIGNRFTRVLKTRWAKKKISNLQSLEAMIPSSDSAKKPEHSRGMHLNIDAVRKLHTNEPLSSNDLDDLERVLTDNKIGKSEYIV